MAPGCLKLMEQFNKRTAIGTQLLFFLSGLNFYKPTRNRPSLVILTGVRVRIPSHE